MQAIKIKELLNERRDALVKESIFTGTARFNRQGSVKDNAEYQARHLEDLGHKIISSRPATEGEHVIVSEKDGKTFTHSLKPHGDGKWTTISTKVKG